MKKFCFTLAILFVGFVATLILLEGVLYFFPVSDGLWRAPVNKKHPVFHYVPNRTITWSQDWNFDLVNKIHINNEGFVNNQDYDPSAKTPLVAVIGDSYVQASLVPYPQTFFGRLSHEFEGKGRIYTFGASASGLSQYLIWAQYARDRYHPKEFIISLFGNDFVESLCSYHAVKEGIYCFNKDVQGNAQFERDDYHPGKLQKILQSTRLGRYLWGNCNIKATLLNLKDMWQEKKRYASNAAFDVKEQEMNDYRWTVDVFLDKLPEMTGVDPAHIVLLVPGFRPEMYDVEQLKEVQASVWAKMRAYIFEQAKKRNIQTLDLHPYFMENYAKDKTRFEFSADNHWNTKAHEVITDAIIKSKFLNNVF